MKLYGIWCSVYKCDTYAGCSNGGISERFTRVFLVTGNPNHMQEEIKTLEEIPENFVKYDHIGCTHHAEPYNKVKWKPIGPMFGGAFIYTSDSRYPFDYPIALHDRYETQEEYDALSD